MLNRGNSSAVTLRKPLPVNDVTFASTIVSQSDTLAASAGAAGTKGTLMCTFAPIASAQGDLVGNFNDKSLVITSTALTTEVPFEVVMTRASADQNSNTVGEGAPDYKAYLSDGEFYVIYETGRIFYSKADASTAVTAAYKYRGGATGPLIAGDVEIGAVEIKNSTTDDRAVVSTAGADAESNTANKFNVVAWLKGFNGTTWDRLRTAVTTVSSTLTGFLNSLPWAIYNATPTKRTEGQGGPLQADVDGNLKVSATMALADGADVTLGAKADDKSTATDTTPVTIMQVLKEISYMLQNPASRAVTNAGTFVVQNQASTSGGWTIYKNIDVDESEDQIKATAGQIGWIHAINLKTTPLYLKFYNATAADVTVGTTVPDLTLAVPSQGTTNGAGFTLNLGAGGVFSTAITVAATTGVADNDTGAPGANELILNLGYK